jgi:hypothetical protein
MGQGNVGDTLHNYNLPQGKGGEREGCRRGKHA